MIVAKGENERVSTWGNGSPTCWQVEGGSGGSAGNGRGRGCSLWMT